MVTPPYQPSPPAESDQLSVLLVEEHAFVRAGLRSLLSATPGLVVAAEARDLETALELARFHRPDVLLINGPALAYADGDGLSAFRREVPQTCVIVLTNELQVHPDDLMGAHRCLSRDEGVRELCTTVASLLRVRCSNCALRALCPVPQIAIALSRRERQVALRVADGLTSKEIAARLGIKPRTVNTYRESLARKLGASSAAVVTRFVIESRLEAGTDSFPLTR